jgi:hypothetical protein
LADRAYVHRWAGTGTITVSVASLEVGQTWGDPVARVGVLFQSLDVASDTGVVVVLSPPAFTVHPVNVTAGLGTVVGFSVSVEPGGVVPLALAWFKGGIAVPLASAANVSFAATCEDAVVGPVAVVCVASNVAGA